MKHGANFEKYNTLWTSIKNEIFVGVVKAYIVIDGILKID